MKLLLIIFVIFGHLLELFKSNNLIPTKIYLIIYTFHMPIFIFLTGMFAKFNKKRIFSLIYIYAVFQIMYRKYDMQLFNTGTELIYKYSTPYWLLWYVFVVIVYNLLIPLFETKRGVEKVIISTIVIWLSLIVNKAGDIGYYASISRFFTFLPYFVLGFYFKDYVGKIDDFFNKRNIVRYVSLAVSFILVILVCRYIYNTDKVTQNMLYGSYSYESAKYGISYKLKFFLFALVWFIFFYLLLPNKKIPFVSILGSNTLTIYLFHGFYVKKLLKMKYFVFDPNTNMKIALLLTVLLILFYGNKYIAKFLRLIFCGEIFIFIYQKLYDMNILRDKQN